MITPINRRERKAIDARPGRSTIRGKRLGTDCRLVDGGNYRPPAWRSPD